MEINLMDKTPLYIQIRNILKDKIETEEWKEGTIIPSEMEISKLYNVSRVTVRQALQELVEDNYLVKRPGFGTMVYRNKASLSNFTLIQSFTNEMKDMGFNDYKTLKAEIQTIKPDRHLAELFNLDDNEELYNLRRVRGSKDTPIVYSNTYLKKVVEIPNEKAIIYGSLYSYLTKKNFVFEKFEEVVSAVEGSRQILDFLNIDDDFSALLKRCRYGYDASQHLVEYTINYYNPVMYEYRATIHHKKSK